MKIRLVNGALTPRRAAAFICSLCFAMPCAAGPFAAAADDPSVDVADIAAANESVPASDAASIDPLAATDVEMLSPASLFSEDSRWQARGGARKESPPGGSLLRADGLAGTLESLLDPGVLDRETKGGYPALPGMSGTPAIIGAVSALPVAAGERLQESTWRETGFNVMRWTSAALAVLAVAGTVIVLAMPGLRRRLFFPDLPQMPPSPA